MKNLALYYDPEECLNLGIEEYEKYLVDVISWFSNIESLILVNRRHKATGSSSGLVFMDLFDLLVWQDYRTGVASIDTGDVDMARLNTYVTEWLENGGGASWDDSDGLCSRFLSLFAFLITLGAETRD